MPFMSTPIPSPKSGSAVSWATRASSWDEHRALITELYAKHTLKKVMQIMRDNHDFYATNKMYKVHLGRWGLQKNLKSSQVGEFLRQKTSGVAKASELYVGGKKVDDKRLEAYLSRISPKRLNQIASAASSPVKAGDTISFVVSCATSPSPEPPMSAFLPFPEECMHILRGYVSGGFEANLWSTEDSVIERKPKPKPQRLISPGAYRPYHVEQWSTDLPVGAFDWFDNVLEAKSALMRGDTQQAFQIFQFCFDYYKKLLSAQTPYLLVTTYISIITLLQTSPEIARSMIKYICELSQIVYKCDHPLSLTMKRLNEVSDEEIRLAAPHVLDFYSKCFEDHSQPNRSFKLGVSRIRVFTAACLSRHGLLPRATAEKIIREELPKAEREAPTSYETLYIKLQFILVVSNKENHDGKALKTMIEDILQVPEVYKYPWIASICLRLLVNQLVMLGDNKGALVLAHQGIEYCLAEFGPGHHVTVSAWQCLEKCYRRSGAQDKADEVHEEGDSSFNEFCKQLERMRLD